MQHAQLGHAPETSGSTRRHPTRHNAADSTVPFVGRRLRGARARAAYPRGPPRTVIYGFSAVRPFARPRFALSTGYGRDAMEAQPSFSCTAVFCRRWAGWRGVSDALTRYCFDVRIGSEPDEVTRRRRRSHPRRARSAPPSRSCWSATRTGALITEAGSHDRSGRLVYVRRSRPPGRVGQHGFWAKPFFPTTGRTAPSCRAGQRLLFLDRDRFSDVRRRRPPRRRPRRSWSDAQVPWGWKRSGGR